MKARNAAAGTVAWVVSPVIYHDHPHGKGEDVRAEEHRLGKYYVYLDELRESGETNMWGASTYLEEKFNMSPNKAVQIVGSWMDTFSERHPA